MEPPSDILHGPKYFYTQHSTAKSFVRILREFAKLNYGTLYILSFRCIYIFIIKKFYIIIYLIRIFIVT